MRRAIGLVLFAACGGSGTAIEITGSTSTTAVELFIGNALVDVDAGTCPDGTPASCLIRPPHPLDPMREGMFRPGHGWTGKALDATRDTAVDGAFGFSLEPDGETYIPALLAVGYDDAEMPTGFALLHDVTVSSSPQVFEIELAPAQYIGVDSMEIDRVQVWRRPGDVDRKQSACALLARTDQSREWFVPADDTDCDGALVGDNEPARECGPSQWTHCGRYPGFFADATCAVAVGTSCRLAGAECVDQGAGCGAAATCAPSVPIACLPPQVCQMTATSGCNTFEWSPTTTCVTQALYNASSQVAPYLSCTFVIDQGTGEVCGGVKAPIPPLNLAVLTQNKPCDQLELGNLGTPATFGRLTVQPSPVATVTLEPQAGCTGTLDLELAPGTTGFDADTLLGIKTTDSHRRYVRLKTNVVFGCMSGASACYWTNAASTASYDFPCD